MNYSDAERVASVFNSHGFSLAKTEKEADIIIAFACSVREKAVHKIMGLGNKWKKMKPKPKTILTGCILPEDKKKLNGKFDLVIEIKEIHKLEKFLNGIKNQELRIKPNSLFIIHNSDIEKENNYLSLKPVYQSKTSAYLPIMTGCDNFCSYCAVPYTRGREVSRSEKDILEEITGLIKSGYKEITLLGQNVNSYKFGFIELLEKIDAIDGDHWIRFYANHPKDFNDELIDFLKKSKHFCHYIHLPLQSGDNEILKKMNRHYTTEQYFKIIKKIRTEIPDCAITTDIIVGFPGESEKQFENTVKFLEKISFDMIFISEYSPRSGTPASKLADDVSHEEKGRRKKYLNDEVLAKSVLKNNKKLVGKKVRFLIYKKDRNGFAVGKTEGLKDVRISVGARFISPEIGNFVDVKITKANSWGLEGEIA